MGKSDLSEDDMGKKWDRCLADSIMKIGAGIGIGMVFSLLFFKRRTWPMLVGGGFGMGVGYSNCERDINEIVRRTAAHKCLS